MRKHKSVVAILLAVMMIFTFMPAMAFAAVGTHTGTEIPSSDVTWTNQFSKVTVKSTKDVYDTYSRLYTPASGITTALAGNDNIKGVVNPVWAEAHYYDVSKATIKTSSNWTYSEMAKLYDEGTSTLKSGHGVELIMHKPDNAEYASGTSAANEGVAFDDSRYSVVYKVAGFDPEKKYEEQNVNLTASIKANTTNPSEVDAANELIVGEVTDTKAIKVKADDGSVNDVNLYWDTVSKKTQITNVPVGSAAVVTYDGAAHKIVTNEVPGYTVELAVLNDKTNKYESVPAEFTKAGTYTVKYTITKTKDGTSTPKTASVTINRATVFSFDFESTIKTSGSNSKYAEVPANADPMDYIVVKEVADSDKEEAMKVFADVCDVTSAPFKGNEKLATWTVSVKKGVDYDALAKKYKDLLDNYNGHPSFVNMGAGGSVSKIVELSADAAVNSKDDDITFTGVTTKAFKAKKKTKKLAKTKSFQIAAAADSGNAVTFKATTSNAKIKVSATGKVTVKKGLKKGTYKVVVKAKTAAGNGYKACKESKTYTIKIK